MKKKILSFILAVCFIIPCMLMIVGCKKQPSKYASIVKQINADATFAEQHMNKIMEDCLKLNIKIATENYGFLNETISSYSHGVVLTYVNNPESEMISSFKYVYGEEFATYFEDEEVGLALNKYGTLMDFLKEESLFYVMAYATEYSARAYNNYYEVKAVISGDELIDEDVEFVMTINVSDGLIRRMFMGGQTVDLEYISDEAVIEEMSKYDVSSVKTMTIDPNVNASGVDMGLFMQMDIIDIGENVTLSEEAELHLADYFLEISDGHYEKFIPED